MTCTHSSRQAATGRSKGGDALLCVTDGLAGVQVECAEQCGTRVLAGHRTGTVCHGTLLETEQYQHTLCDNAGTLATTSDYFSWNSWKINLIPC